MVLSQKQHVDIYIQNVLLSYDAEENAYLGSSGVVQMVN